MCGISGLLVYADAEPVGERELRVLRDAQQHRGPDDEGLWISEDRRTGLGHNRLSIVDLSPRGRQPMTTADERFRLVYNGEIYNFRALRSELEECGHRFESDCDSEVLLHGYREWGLALLDRLRGMFAFALHDAERGETLLARDPLGIKPLYLSEYAGRLAFASEVQALRRIVPDRGIDPEGLATYLLWGSIGAPRTLYRSIRALEPGTWMRIGGDGIAGPSSYYRLEEEFGHAEGMDAVEAAESLRSALVDSVRHHMIADVKVGAFLSGGVDSSALVGLMAEVHDAPICTVTLAFDDPALDESDLARRAADLYGSEHHEIQIGTEEVRDRMGDAVRALDQPSVDGVNTYFVSEAAARAGLKVAVSGVGGDELFGGYRSFHRVPRILRTHAAATAIPGGGRALSAAAGLLQRLPRTRTRAALVRALEFGGDVAGAYYSERGLFSPAEVRELLAPEVVEAVEVCDPRMELNARVCPDSLPESERVSALEMRQYLQVQLLRDTDAVAMRHSLEVRTPLVDRDLLSAVARVPASLRRAGPSKLHLRQAPRPPIPEALWRRRKQGFTLPFDDWLRGGEISTTLPKHEWLRPEGVRRVAQDFERGRVHWSRLWALLVLREFLN
ncbi:MAG: asparagine synthase (glutamine-hydrolyzing) [Myxococcota bacterium]